VVFRRRSKRTFGEILIGIFYPRGGWRRAVSYVGHRLSRLPDTPKRISLGIAAGTMVSFTPLFGLHFLLAMLIARVIGGNILAALLGTFFGNPITFPIIAELSVQVGAWILGQGGGMHFPQVMAAMGFAWAEIWYNLVALVTAAEPNWFRLRLFFNRVFLPYLVGGLLPGLIASVVMYYVCLPLIRAYQTRRKNKLRERFIRTRAAAAERASDAEKSGKPQAPTDSTGGDAPPSPPQ